MVTTPTYRVTVTWAEIHSGMGDRMRWQWRVSEVGGYLQDEGHSRWRWRAERQARKSLAKVTNGIEFTTETSDLTCRIEALEAELFDMQERQ